MDMSRKCRIVGVKLLRVSQEWATLWGKRSSRYPALAGDTSCYPKLLLRAYRSFGFFGFNNQPQTSPDSSPLPL